MDIRTKLVFALVALALGSMLTLGFFMYENARGKLDESAESQIGAIAVSSETAIEEVLAGWRERVQLIASRTQLRLSLEEYARTGSLTERRRIDRILDDAWNSVRSIRALGVYDRDGRLVESAGEALPEAREPVSGPLSADDGGQDAADMSPNGPREPRFVSAVVNDEGGLRVSLAADLLLDGRPLGEMVVVLTGREILDLVEDFPGLGETGEILIVMRDGATLRTLHPANDPVTGQRGIVELADADDPIVRLLRTEKDTFPGAITDYRGETVFAATRHIDETGWGVVVKFDKSEVQRPFGAFRSDTVTLALSLSAFAILFAVLLGMRFASPIHQLADVANRIRGGEMDARATVKREDELGMLARDFNAMANELQVRMDELHQYRMFFELSLDMLCIAGTDGYFKRVNPTFERILGWSTDELLERPFMDLVHPDDVEATTREIEKLAQGIPTISFVNRFRCADGTYRHLRWTSHPEPDGTLYASAREIDDPSDFARIV